MKKNAASIDQAAVDAAAWDMAMKNKGLVGSILNKEFSWLFLDGKGEVMIREDYEQEGFIGLYRAAKKYDPSRGKFSTYAYIWIKQAISRAFRAKHFRVARVAYGVYDELSKIRKEHGESSGEWLAKNGKKSVQDGYNALTKVSSIEADAAAHAQTSIENVAHSSAVPIYDTKKSVVQKIGEQDYSDLIRAAAKLLLPEEKRVIFLKFGMDSRPLTMRQICRKTGMSRKKCFDSERNGMNKIREFFQRQNITNEIMG